MYGSMRPAFTTASDFAKQSGTPYSVLITTTPKELGGIDSDINTRTFLIAGMLSIEIYMLISSYFIYYDL